MIVVAIDGPAGVGKSTVARRVAAALGVPYLDTGAMYRAVAWKALAEDLDPAEESAMEALTRRIDLELRAPEGSRPDAEVAVDGFAPGPQLRAPAIDAASAQVAVHPGIRSWLVERQRQFAAREGAVVEGRDIGTVVFPGARHKFFLDAPLEVRAERRLQQGAGTGRRDPGDQDRDRARLRREMQARDERDTGRAASPLRRDASYQVIDTSTGGVDDVAARILRSVRAAAPDR